MSQVQGHCDTKFEEVKTLLQHFIDAGDECGAAITVNINGKQVIDIWGGHKDPSKTAPWERDTIVNVWSSTKTVVSLAGLMLIDRGLISPSTKISEIWPEFGVNGKENIEFRMFMSHTSGLSGWAEKVSLSDIYDTAKVTSLLGQQAPFWEPGTASGYHVTTHGFLIGEVVRRTTGKSLTQFVADEIAGPLKADFQIGCIEPDWQRTAEIIPQKDWIFPQIDPESVAFKTVTNGVMDAASANTPEYRKAEIGSSNGHGTARALNKILSAITLDGSVDGVRILKPETIELIFQEQSFGTDLVLGLPLRFGIGYGLGGKDTTVNWIPEENVCFWSGWGGSFGLMDRTRGLTFTYVMNQMGAGTVGNKRTVKYVKALYQILNGSAKI